MSTPPEGPPGGPGPSGDDSEGLLVGDLMLTRTFRLAADGFLYPVFNAVAWREGTLTAFCKLGRAHAAPATDCTCGFYAYSDPADLGEQPPWRQVAAVVGFTGAVEIGTRGARAQHARLQALWLGRRVTPALAEAVANTYPGVAIYRDRELMFAEHPLTGPPVFPAPRHDVAARARGRLALRAYCLTAFVGGLVPAVSGLRTVTGGAVWVALVLGAITAIAVSRLEKSPLVALAGFLALCWLMPSFAHISSFARTQALLTAVVSVATWQYRARPGQPAPPPGPSRWRSAI